MKTILFLFLLTISVRGQDTIPSTDSGYEQAIKNGIAVKWTPSVLSLMKAYEKECYADSSIDAPNCTFDFVPDTTEGNHIHYKPLKIIAYKHREPTFKGFLEFIKRYE